MYSEYVKCSDELEVEKAENQRLNSYLDQILVVSKIMKSKFNEGDKTKFNFDQQIMNSA